MLIIVITAAVIVIAFDYTVLLENERRSVRSSQRRYKPDKKAVHRKDDRAMRAI